MLSLHQKKSYVCCVCVCLSALSCGAVLDLSCFEVESSGKSRINEGTLPYFAIGLGGDMEVSNPWGYPQFSSIYGFSTKKPTILGYPHGLMMYQLACHKATSQNQPVSDFLVP